MGFIKERIKNHVKEKIHPRILYKIDILKADLKKKFTIAWLFFIGILLILQGIVRLLPYLINVPEYVGFFVIGIIILIVAFIYQFRSRKKNYY